MKIIEYLKRELDTCLVGVVFAITIFTVMVMFLSFILYMALAADPVVDKVGQSCEKYNLAHVNGEVVNCDKLGFRLTP